MGWGSLPPELDCSCLRNYIFIDDLAGMRDRAVDYVVFHKNPLAEFRLAEMPEYVRRVATKTPDLSAGLDLYDKTAGEAVFEDQTIIVFCLNRNHEGSKSD